MKQLRKSIFLYMLSILNLPMNIAATENTLSQTQLHAVLGVVNNFILDDAIVHNTTTYRTITSPYTGRVWLDRNLGASRVCDTLNDTQCYGDNYQWGRGFDGHQDKNSMTSTYRASNVNNVESERFLIQTTAPYDWAYRDNSGRIRQNLWLNNTANSVCPVGFRVPTITELKAELLDTHSAQIINNIGAFNSFLKLPSNGYRATSDGSLYSEDYFGYLWSVSTSRTSPSYVYFDATTAGSSDAGVRANGFAVRCIKKITSKEIIHNGTLYGEVTSPYTGKVWLDRNLGAKRVCQSFDDFICYGDHYQWGRNFDGHQKRFHSTSKTRATDINNAGSSFIEHISDWTSVDSTGGLRSINWLKTDGSSVCPLGFRVPTLLELKSETIGNDINTTTLMHFLKFPLAGIRNNYRNEYDPRYDDEEDPQYIGEESEAAIWSSSVNGYNSSMLSITPNDVRGKNNGWRTYGYSVRCIKD